jgi:amino acid permease
MDKYQKMITGFLIVAGVVALIFVFVVFNGSGGSESSSDDSGFPFFIFFPSWIAIFIPIISQKRQEAKKEEELRNQLEE